MLHVAPWWVLYPGGGLLLLVAMAFLLFSLYVAYIHWKYSHLPSPRMPSFYLGHVPDIMTMRKQSGNDSEPMCSIIQKWSEKAGDLFVIFLLYEPWVVSLNPEDVKTVASDKQIAKPRRTYKHIVSLFGRRFMGQGLLSILNYETWKPKRKLYDPSFKRSSLKELLPLFNECCNTFLDVLRPLADGKREVDMKEAFYMVALDSISKVAFSSDFNQSWDTNPKYSSLSHLNSIGIRGLGKSISSISPIVVQLLHPYEVAMYHESVDAMRKIGRDCIERRIKAVISGEEVPNDILTQMLQGCVSNSSVDLESLVDDFVTFYVAGQDTTASTLSFAIILTHQHPQILDRLLSEVEDVLGDRKEVTGDDLDKMTYTEQVIQEVLRMHSPGDGFARESPKGGMLLRGFYVPEGTIIMFNHSVMSRNPKYFNDPETFDPSRFDKGKERPGPYVYFPFSAGHRSCIGRHFAMIEAKVVLARLLQTFKLTLAPSYKMVVEQTPTLQPKGGVPCTLQKITK